MLNTVQEDITLLNDIKGTKYHQWIVPKGTFTWGICCTIQDSDIVYCIYSVLCKFRMKLQDTELKPQQVLEMFIEHIPRAECLQCSYNRRDISADAHRTGGIAFVYGHIQGVGVTAYRIYIIIIVKLKRWGQMLRIIGDSCKKQPKQ